MNKHDIKKVVLGQNRPVLFLTVFAGIVLGMDLWWLLHSVDFATYHLIPENSLDWQFIAVFIGIPALISKRQGGLLGCLWVGVPPHFAMYFHSFSIVATSTGAGPTREFIFMTGLEAAVAAITVALVWGTIGYLIGKTSQVVISGITTFG